MNVLIHITRQSDLSGLISTSSSGSLSGNEFLSDKANTLDASPPLPQGDLEKGALQQSAAAMTFAGNEIQPGRPDINSLIENIVTSSCSAEDRIIIGACGPSDLMRTTRQAVNSGVLNAEWSIKLYSEVSDEGEETTRALSERKKKAVWLTWGRNSTGECITAYIDSTRLFKDT